MNAQIANLKPLSPALQGPFPANLNHPARRQFVGNVLLRMEALVHFNQLLARLQHFPLHRDQVATASRELAKPVNDQRQPVGIERRLLPRGIPQIGRLDDAILVDAAWPQLVDEVDDYLDFCRLRTIEAGLRGCDVADFAFSRDDWQQARCAEAGLKARARRAATNSYLPAPARTNFRVF